MVIQTRDETEGIKEWRDVAEVWTILWCDQASVLEGVGTHTGLRAEQWADCS